MAIDLQPPPQQPSEVSPSQPSVTSLVGGILNDVQDLIKQQVSLIGKEITDDINKSIGAAISLAAGAPAIVAMGGFLLVVTVALVLDAYIPQLQGWGGFAIVGGVLTVVGLGLLFSAYKRFEHIKALPETMQALKETVTWQTNPK